MSQHGEGSEAGEEYSYYSSSGTVDTLEDLLQRFTLDYQPDYALKLRHSVGPLVLGADLSQAAAGGQRVLAALVKPSSKEQWWRRLKLDTSGLVTVRSRKLRWWVFTLDLEGQLNPRTRSTNLGFRVATKWDVARGQIRNKRRVAMGPGAEARVHWALSYHLPEIEGSFGTAQRQLEREVHADVGYCHAEIPKLELVVWPSRLRAPPPLIASPSPSSVAAGAGGADAAAAGEAADGQRRPEDGGGKAVAAADAAASVSSAEGQAEPPARQPSCTAGGDAGSGGKEQQRPGWPDVGQALLRLRGRSASLSLVTLQQFTRPVE